MNRPTGHPAVNSVDADLRLPTEAADIVHERDRAFKILRLGVDPPMAPPVGHASRSGSLFAVPELTRRVW